MKRIASWMGFLITLLAAATGAARDDNHIGEAGRFYDRGEYARAAELLRQRVRAEPQDGTLRLWLGKSYLKSAKWDDAVRELEAATRLEADRAETHLWLGRAYGRKAEHSSFLTAIGWARKVRKEFETAIRLGPDNFDARFDLLEFLVEAPGIAGGGMDRAEALSAEISRLDPKLRFVVRARLLEKEKKWDDARRELIQATEEFPERIEAHLDLAEFLIKRKDFVAAESSAQRAILIDSRSPRARLDLAASQIEERKAGAETLRVVEDLASGALRDHDPAFSDVHYWCARAALLLGNRDEARAEFEAALRFDPDHARAKEALSHLR